MKKKTLRLLLFLFALSLIPYPSHVAPEIHIEFLTLEEIPIGNLEVRYSYSKFPDEDNDDYYSLNENGRLKIEEVVVWKNFLVRLYWVVLDNITMLGFRLPYVRLIINMPSYYELCIDENHLKKISESNSRVSNSVYHIFEDEFDNIISLEFDGSKNYTLDYQINYIWKRKESELKLYFRDDRIISNDD